jgi:hypothetical protein
MTYAPGSWQEKLRVRNMSENHQNGKTRVFVPWLVSLIIVIVLIVLGFVYRKATISTFEGIARRNEILSTMRINLLKAIEAEKSAILPETEEASQSFADQARAATDSVEKGRREIEAIINEERMPKEMRLMEEFDLCWMEFQRLDQMLLALAVQDTNVKATRLSSTKAAEVLRRFEEHLTHLIQANSNGAESNQVLELSYAALVAGLKIHSLHTIHIPEPTDEQMDAIEKQMKSYDQVVRTSLNSLSRLVAESGQDDLKQAVKAYDEFMRLTDEVIRLSRMNTNIKSLELSLGRKRMVSAQCEEVLTALQEAVRSRTPKVTWGRDYLPAPITPSGDRSESKP